MVVPLIIAAALVVGGIADVFKDVSSANTRDSQLKANDHALALEEEKNADLAQQARLAVMGGAFSGGSFEGYISKQLEYSNADLVARRKNISLARSNNRFQEVMSVVSDAAKTAVAVGNSIEVAKGIKDAKAAVSTLKNINSNVSQVIKNTEPITKEFGDMIDKAGASIGSYLDKIEAAGKTGLLGLAKAGESVGDAI